MLSWKSNADESDGLTTHFPTLPRDRHQLSTANLVGQKPADACHELKEEQHIVQIRYKCRWIVAALCPTENEED